MRALLTEGMPLDYPQQGRRQDTCDAIMQPSGYHDHRIDSPKDEFSVSKKPDPLPNFSPHNPLYLRQAVHIWAPPLFTEYHLGDGSTRN